MGVTKHPLFLEPGHLGRLRADERSIARLRASYHELALHGTALADVFYARLFERQPALRGLFPSDLAAQKKKLLDSLGLVVANLHEPALVATALERLGHGHVGYGARTEHYPIVCAELLAAIGEIGGPTFDADLLDEWRTALEQVSAAMLRGAARPSAI